MINLSQLSDLEHLDWKTKVDSTQKLFLLYLWNFTHLLNVLRWRNITSFITLKLILTKSIHILELKYIYLTDKTGNKLSVCTKRVPLDLRGHSLKISTVATFNLHDNSCNQSYYSPIYHYETIQTATPCHANIYWLVYNIAVIFQFNWYYWSITGAECCNKFNRKHLNFWTGIVL